MGMFTIVPVWVAQDVTVIILAVVTILFIIRKEAHPGQIFLEFVCFVFLNAAVFENFAVLQGWYGYGRSVLMLFQVPLSVPILEYLVVYSSLRIMSAMTSRDGIERPVEISISPILYKEGDPGGAVIVFRDYSDQERKEREIEYLSYHGTSVWSETASTHPRRRYPAMKP